MVTNYSGVKRWISDFDKPLDPFKSNNVIFRYILDMIDQSQGFFKWFGDLSFGSLALSYFVVKFFKFGVVYKIW